MSGYYGRPRSNRQGKGGRMIELIESALAAMYDALMRGVCWSITFGIAWTAGWFIIRHAVKVFKAAGAW